MPKWSTQETFSSLNYPLMPIPAVVFGPATTVGLKGIYPRSLRGLPPRKHNEMTIVISSFDANLASFNSTRYFCAYFNMYSNYAGQRRTLCDR